MAHFQIPKPVSTSQRIPSARAKSEDPKWNFSFKYWKQVDYFGLETTKCDGAWFTSLLEKLKYLSEHSIEKFLKDDVIKDYWRFHKINWSQPNIPISKTQFEGLLPKGTLSEEIEVCQFMISKGSGRIVGFFDSDNIFNIVLLDPLHNIQPAKDYGYAVNPTGFKLTEIEEHRERLKLLKVNFDALCAKPCDMRSRIDELVGAKIGNRFFCLNDFISEDKIQTLLEKHNSIEEIVLEAIHSIMPK